MNLGVGRLDSPKYSRSTPSIDIAISPSSRIRVYGTRASDAEYGIKASPPPRTSTPTAPGSDAPSESSDMRLDPILTCVDGGAPGAPSPDPLCRPRSSQIEHPRTGRVIRPGQHLRPWHAVRWGQ